MTTSIFTISLDFELLWGVSDHRTVQSYGSTVLEGRRAVVQMLDFFQKQNIHVTWATVGMLMCDNKDNLLKLSPSKSIDYENDKLSNYQYLNNIGVNEVEDPFHFAPSLLAKIRDTAHQEIASHTFSHFYCLEKGQSIEDFELDVLAFAELSKQKGFNATSIVFPRNQYNPNYLSVLEKYGYTAFRGNENHWLYDARVRKSESLYRRMIRLIDGYINLSGHHTFSLNELKKEQALLNIPASRFFRPYNPTLFFLENLKIKRIKVSMKRAAIKGEVFHLWWHPHNFGSRPERMMKQLNDIISYYQQLKKQYGMQSLTMSEIRSLWDKLEKNEI